MPGRSSIHRQLQIGNRHARRLKQCQRFCLGIECVERSRLARLPVARAPLTREQQTDGRLLAIGKIAPPDFEQTNAACPAIVIAPRRGNQAGDQRRAHMLHLFANRVGQHIRRPAEQRRFGLADEAPVDRLVEPACGRRAPQLAFDHLSARRGRLGDPVGSRQRGRDNLVVTDDPHHFLDQIGAAIDVAAPAGDDRFSAFNGESKSLEDRNLLTLGHIDPAQRLRPLRDKRHPSLGHWRFTRAHHRAGLATAMVDYQPRRDRQSLVEERRIDAALESRSRIAGQQQFLPGPRDPLGIKISAFDQDVGRPRRHPAILAAHDPANVVHLGIIGDHRHRLIERVALAVERDHAFASLRPARDQSSVQLGAIIDMQRPAEIDRQKIGDVDQHRNRFLPDRFQLGLEPIRRLAIDQTAHRLRVEPWAALGIVGPNVGRRSFAIDWRDRRLAIDLGQRPQRPQSRRRQVAGNAAHAHAILPIGGDGDVEQAIVEPGKIGEARPHRRIGGQLDDPVMILAQLQLARRTHHSVGFDPADRGFLEREVAPRNIGPRPAEHADHACARIGRTAHHLLRRAVPGVDGQHLQLVRLRVPLGGQHPRDDERLQYLGRAGYLFNFQPDRGQLFRNGRGVGIGIEMLLEPAQREFHAPTPPLSVGTSRKRKP